MSDILLTKEQKQEELDGRVKLFTEDFKKLCETHKLRLEPQVQYLPNGIVTRLSIIDTKE